MRQSQIDNILNLLWDSLACKSPKLTLQRYNTLMQFSDKLDNMDITSEEQAYITNWFRCKYRREPGKTISCR